ncbi:MAG: MBL fold metallo-hydrolase [Verrucomicrobiae bacterium]|nr:MBL fold metallo-hydrolase [Verrucomicrobiae bacterium]
MNLEDSLGDILRKARLSNQVGSAEAAAAAGLATDAYEQMEATGTAASGTRFEPLAALLTLSGPRLEGIAHGWRPEPVDLSQWQGLEVITTEGDGMTVNAFLAWDPGTHAAALFDTGFEDAPIVELIARHQLHLQQVFITHAHGDHVAALAPLRERYPAARVHSGSSRAPADQRLTDGAKYAVGSLQVTHRATPGHAEDGVTYVVTGWGGGAPSVAVVGDAIFAGSMGGAREQLPLARRRVREMILSMAEATLICPGHGPLTTVGQEKLHNPWFP